jgi:undecaprenyl pyrophosphate synthase
VSPSPKPPRKLSIDGFPRSPDVERRLNDLFAEHAAGSAAFREILTYLRSITIEAVTGPGVSNDELRHREGQRFVVGLIEQRIQMGRKQHEPT